MLNCSPYRQAGWKIQDYTVRSLLKEKPEEVFIITRIRYSFGPDDYYGDSSNINVTYQKSKGDNASKMTWKSDDNLVSNGALLFVPKKMKIVVRRKTDVLVEGIADRSGDPDKRCSNSFRF